MMCLFKGMHEGRVRVTFPDQQAERLVFFLTGATVKNEGE